MKKKNNFVKFLNSKKINKPYLIAEIGSNHNGNMQLCEKQIKLAAKAGADAVKFQKFNEKNIFSKSSYKKNKLLKSSDVKKFTLSLHQMLKIKKICQKYNIDYGITPLSYEEVDEIVNNVGVDFLKVASCDANNIEFVKYIAKKKKPTIISFGMCNHKEIKKTTDSFLKINQRLAIMHCVSIYPTPFNKINLKKIPNLQNLFKNIKVGFSDHSLGITATLASISVGAKLIEKHFTSNKKLKGWDHSMSLNYDELKELALKAKQIMECFGSSKLERTENKNVLHFFRRSIVVKKNLEIGHKISRKDLDFKRPGNGINPNDILKVIGLRLKRKKKHVDLLSFSDLKK
jgi:sialic acid synthase SpsE